MSARPPAAAAGAPAASASRLHAVLDVGVKQSTLVGVSDTGAKQDNTNSHIVLTTTNSSTSTIVVPSEPGKLAPVVLPQPPLDPSKLKDGVLPGSLLERRTYPRAVWNALPKELPPREDAYGNLVTFELVDGAEALRTIITAPSRISYHSLYLNSATVAGNYPSWRKHVVEFDGPPSKEYPVQWTEHSTFQGEQLREPDFVKFEDEGTSIASMSVTLSNMVNIGIDFPPALTDPGAFNLEASLSETINQYGWMVEGVLDLQQKHGMGADNLLHLQRGTRIVVDEDGLSFQFRPEYDTGLDGKRRSKRQTHSVASITFRPEECTRKDLPALVVMMTDGRVITYIRGGELYLNKETGRWSSSSVRDFHFDQTQSSVFETRPSDFKWRGSDRYFKYRKQKEQERIQNWVFDEEIVGITGVAAFLVAIIMCALVKESFPSRYTENARCSTISIMIALTSSALVNSWGLEEYTTVYYPYEQGVKDEHAYTQLHTS